MNPQSILLNFFPSVYYIHILAKFGKVSKENRQRYIGFEAECIHCTTVGQSGLRLNEDPDLNIYRRVSSLAGYQHGTMYNYRDSVCEARVICFVSS